MILKQINPIYDLKSGVVRAAILGFGLWLAHPCEASSDSVVVFNEIHYNPLESSGSGEWVELFNQMGIKVDVSGWQIDGIGYTFPEGTILNPGQYIVVAKNPSAGQLGPFTGALNNGGENLVLLNQSDRLMDEVDYDNDSPWPPGADHSGSTLAKIAAYTSSGEPENWAVSRETGGTPGAVNFTAEIGTTGLRFNEILPATAAPLQFGIELKNTGSQGLQVGGMVVSADGDTARQYILPASTIPAGSFLYLSESTLGFRPVSGEKVFLYSPSRASLVDAREVTSKLRGASPQHPGKWLFPDVPTPSAENAFTFNDSIVISELQYNPPSLPAAPGSPAVFENSQLLGFSETWRYNASDDSLPASWATVSHAVAGNWQSGTGPIGFENNPLPVPLATTISPYSSSTVTYYFETDFNITPGQLSSIHSLEITHQVDDGAVFYLNGTELTRFNIPDGVVGPETQASPSVGVSAALVTVEVPPTALISGSNRLSVEVHQTGTSSSDVVFGMKLDARVLISPEIPSMPLRNSDNQWLELVNRSASPVALDGWSLDDGITFTFPKGTTLAPGEHACVVRDFAAFSSAYPNARVLGIFSGNLSRSGELISLRDANNNPADEVRYYDDGRWPEFSDGGGKSLELKDLRSDNAQGGAWAESDESSHTEWRTYSYDAEASPSKGNDGQWSEFNLGLLSAGEVWIDDVSVIERPNGAATQKLSDTGFDNAALWRLRGNHRHSEIISEPGNPGNKILRIVASGPTEHMHNQIETTLASSIINGRDYRISFRARWVGGSNQLHTRCYFNRLANMNVIDRPGDPGTPSLPNSRATANVGPTFSALNHSPAVPAVSQPVTISASSSDPDGISTMDLFHSTDGGAFVSTPMTLDPTTGRYQGTVPGKAAGSIVQFYLRATDSLGDKSFFPAAGPDSRALYQVDDGKAATNGLHNFRLITTLADRDFMHTVTEVMSNDRIESTVIDREGDIYYGAGVRLKSSQRGRAETARVGYNLKFPSDGLFRGAHDSVAVDRSEGQAPGQRELLFDTMISNAGGVLSRYNDLIRILSPNPDLTGSAVLQMARYEDVFLDSQFDNGSDGSLFEYEFIYYPTTADSSGRKLPQPDRTIGVTIGDQGSSIEDYRWNFLNKINREAENFEPIIRYNELFSKTGSDFESALPAAIDLDNWFRGMAYAVLSGAGDNAGAGSLHNGIYYARQDGRIIFLPHDMDFSFSTNRSISANNEVARLIQDPSRRRLFYGHLQDIISTTYNNSYMSTWTNQFATLDPEQDWADELTFITQRSNNVLSQISSSVPQIAFSVTTASPYSTSSGIATIQGKGWVNLREIRLASGNSPLGLTWLDENTWETSFPVPPGQSIAVLQAFDFSGNPIGSGSVTINSSNIQQPASAANLVISEFMYHPSDASIGEVNAGFTDQDLFEFIELTNVSQTPVNLTGVHFTDGIDYNFSAGESLAAGEKIVVVKNRAAFQFRNPGAAASMASGAFLNDTNLRNSGETITLNASDGNVIQSITYTDDAPWPIEADGGGYSLVLARLGTNPDPNLPENWRISSLGGGNPAASDVIAFTGNAQSDDDLDGLPSLVEYALGTSTSIRNGSALSSSRDSGNFVTITFETALGAEDATLALQSSEDLVKWDGEFVLVSREPTGEGTLRQTLRSAAPINGKYFLRFAAEMNSSTP